MPESPCRLAEIIDGDLADRYRTPIAANIALADAVVDQTNQVEDNRNAPTVERPAKNKEMKKSGIRV